MKTRYDDYIMDYDEDKNEKSKKEKEQNCKRIE